MITLDRLVNVLGGHGNRQARRAGLKAAHEARIATRRELRQANEKAALESMLTTC